MCYFTHSEDDHNQCLFTYPLQVQRAFPPYTVHTEGLFQAATHNLRNNLFSTIQASWCCWPVINFLNFKFVPAPYRSETLALHSHD